MTIQTRKDALTALKKKAEESWRADDQFRLGYEQALRDLLAAEEEPQHTHDSMSVPGVWSAGGMRR